MPEDNIQVFKVVDLIEALSKRNPQITIHNLNIYVTQNTTTTHYTDCTFIDNLEIKQEEKTELKSAFEKFKGTLTSFKEGVEGLRELTELCFKLGPAATIVITEGAKMLSSLSP